MQKYLARVMPKSVKSNARFSHIGSRRVVRESRPTLRLPVDEEDKIAHLSLN